MAGKAKRRILAIDPGPEFSAWVELVDGKPTEWAKEPNAKVLGAVQGAGLLLGGELAIESIASYGMAVGAEVFETCVWSGRFIEAWAQLRGEDAIRRVYRRDVKLHLCGQARAKDGNVRQALIDRFGPGKEKAIGRKATPGPLYGMAGDCWQALGVGVTVFDGGVG